MSKVSKINVAIGCYKNGYIKEVEMLLRKDPEADSYSTKYPELTNYLIELFEKDNSICAGIINALEHYLEK